MDAHDDTPLRERLQHWIAHLAHVLPAQAPIRDFVHHNTLHGFQHLPFDQALAMASALTGAQTYWPETRFRACFDQGRITWADLEAALEEVDVPNLDEILLHRLSRREILVASLIEGGAPRDAQRIAWEQREGVGDDAGFAHFFRLTAGDANLPEETDWRTTTRRAWDAQCQRVGKDWTWRRLLDELSGEDVLESVRGILQRHLAAHLDLGVAAWRNPARERGFFAAWRASAGYDLAWELDELPNVRDEILHLPDDPVAVLLGELPVLLPDASLWPGYLERLSLELAGWSGMFLWRAEHVERGDGTPVAMVDYLAVRVLLERLLTDDLARRLVGSAVSRAELQAHFAKRPEELLVRHARTRCDLPEALLGEVGELILLAKSGRVAASAWAELANRLLPAMQRSDAQSRAWQMAALARRLGFSGTALETFSTTDVACLDTCLSTLTPEQRRRIWLHAYERHYREELFTSLAANHGRKKMVLPPSAQVVMCMDDREEGTRRHLEELAPEIVTYGAAGFFGVPMFWQGLDDVEKTALCPVVVTPRNLVREVPRESASSALERHRRRRESRLRWREQLFQATRRRAIAGPLLSALAAVPAVLSLSLASLSPRLFGEAAQRWRAQHDGRLATALEMDAAVEDDPAGGVRHGFTDAEQVDRVEAFLRMIGLVDGFAPLVLMLGHGSSSLNNPHLSAYDCGACSGKHGGPNARVFAAMANRAAVRAGLAARGLSIPETTWFVAAEHNTCDDSVAWYDLEAVPEPFQAAVNVLLGQLAEACRRHAVERCRRLASAPLNPAPWVARQHMSGRANDISQARPELGHATNAAALIGRREMSRGLFLDRRVFLISYDPEHDGDGRIVESILLAAGPVGAGISLEYYFSSVDNERFGCGSKITHNITGLFGVMEGSDSDLRTGLPWQMVEIHEPMRLLVVVEQSTETLSAILQRQPALQELIGKAWIVLAAKSPSTAEIAQYCPRRGWLPWSGSTVLPRVARSADWFAGESGALSPALLLGGA